MRTTADLRAQAAKCSDSRANDVLTFVARWMDGETVYSGELELSEIVDKWIRDPCADGCRIRNQVHEFMDRIRPKCSVEHSASMHCYADEHWVCRKCIGHDNFEEYTIGLLGPETCEVCGRLYSRPHIACVSHRVYMAAMKLKDPASAPSEGK